MVTCDANVLNERMSDRAFCILHWNSKLEERQKINKCTLTTSVQDRKPTIRDPSQWVSKGATMTYSIIALQNLT